MIGSPVVLQTFRRIVVLPALARPITRIRNFSNFARVFRISSVVRWGCDEVDIAKGFFVDVECEQSILSHVIPSENAH